MLEKTVVLLSKDADKCAKDNKVQLTEKNSKREGKGTQGVFRTSPKANEGERKSYLGFLVMYYIPLYVSHNFI